jgi:hypothetical protein
VEEVMNDYYVNTNCKTRVHIGSYVFTIEELFNIACDSLSSDEIEKYKECIV